MRLISDPRLVCAVDIGSNSVKTIIGTHGKVLHEDVVQTRLGIGVDGSGLLNATAISDTVAALALFSSLADKYGATERCAVATSAVRDAKNAASVVSEFTAAFNGPVRVIGGDEEAALVYAAAVMDPEFSQLIRGTVVATDVGGGSTEVIIGHSGVMQQHSSLQIGAVRLSDRHNLLGNDPINQYTLTNLDDDIWQHCQELPRVATDTFVISSGGTAANIGGGILGKKRHKLHGLPVSIDQIRVLRAHLAGMDLEARQKVPGINPRRADVIIAGLSIQLGIMEVMGCERLLISLCGLRYGLYWRLLEGLKDGLDL